MRAEIFSRQLRDTYSLTYLHAIIALICVLTRLDPRLGQSDATM